MNLLNLNLDLLQTIYSFLPYKDLVNLKQVSKKNKQLIDTSSVLNNKINKVAKAARVNLLETLSNLIGEMDTRMSELNLKGYHYTCLLEKTSSFKQQDRAERRKANNILKDISNKYKEISKLKNNLDVRLCKLKKENPIAEAEFKIYSLFNGKENFEKLPVLELISLDLGKVYLEKEGITPEQMTHSIMRGTDKCGRLFFAIKALGNDGKFHIQTFFPRDIDKARWTNIGYKHVSSFSLCVSVIDATKTHNELTYVNEGLNELQEFIKPLIKDL